MTYGYTIANGADQDCFREARAFLADKLNYHPIDEELEDVDETLSQHLSNGENTILLKSDVEVDYVFIASPVPLPLTCLVKWTRD